MSLSGCGSASFMTGDRIAGGGCLMVQLLFHGDVSPAVDGGNRD